MSRFKECVDAIRHNGLYDAADVVKHLAIRKPKLYAAVSIGQTNYGDECNGLSPEEPRVFLTQDSADREVERLTRDYWRNTPLSEVLERFEMESHVIDAGKISEELTRILDVPIQFPGPDVEYWNDERCKRPLLPAETSDEKTSKVAKLMGLKLYKVISLDCDANLTTPDDSSARGTARNSPFSAKGSTSRGILSLLPWRRQ